MNPAARLSSAILLLAALLGGCNDNSGGTAPPASTPTATSPAAPATPAPAPAPVTAQQIGVSGLTQAQAETVIARAVQEAQARGARATIAVVDRVGNVLAVFRMNGATTSVTVADGIGRNNGSATGLDRLAVIPDTLAAIAKAVTAAYLSTEGNAFSTRTANQIIQEHFNVHEIGQPGGPLFGVQFSQLPCSDLNTRGTGTGAGPKRSPLGFSGDPGGLPLYLGATPVGAIGVIADGVYGLDRNILNRDRSIDELIATAGTAGFAAPADRRANRISVDGRLLRFSDVGPSDLVSVPAAAPPFASISGGAAGALVDVPGYYSAATGVLAGTVYGQTPSGIRPDAGTDFPGMDTYVLDDGTGNNRFPPTAGTAPAGSVLTAAEVRQLLRSALTVANRARAQIRRPTGSRSQVSVSVVDSAGNITGIARTRDAPVFGIDVSLQKARTAAFFSATDAAALLIAAPDTTYLNPDGSASGVTIRKADYVTAVRAFLGNPQALADGTAFADRSGGNLSRPFFPDGVDGYPNGPLSKPLSGWSPFSTGLQLDLVYTAIIDHVLFVRGANPADVGTDCTGVGSGRIPNGIQIFPGSVPIYRGATLVGAIGVSGDGVDQDDLIAFLGLHEAGLALGGSIGNAPRAQRADRIYVPGFGFYLRYVQCPQSPYVNSSAQNVCAGK